MADADRIRLAARVQADYDNYGYAPLLADDMRALAGVGLDVEAGFTKAENAAFSGAANAVLTDADRIAAAASAASAATTVPASVDRILGLRANDTPFWSMVRSTPAWGFGPSGLLEETAIDTIRWGFNPVTRSPLGVAFAGARTNHITNPRTPGAAGWSNTNITVSSSVPGPDGDATSARRLSEGTGTGNHRSEANGTTPTFTAGLRYPMSIFAKADTAGTIQIMRGGTPFGTTNFANFDLTNGVIGTAGSDVTQHRIVSVGGGWFLCSCAMLCLSTSTTTEGTVVMTTSSSAARLQSYTGTSRTVDVAFPWGENAALFASDPILPPVGAPAASTRAQGTVTIPVAQLGTRYNYRSGTIIVDCASQSGAFTSASDLDFFGLVSLGDTGANEVMGMVLSTNHLNVAFRRTVGGVAQTSATVTIAAPTAGQTFRAAFSWDLDAQIMQVAARGSAGTQVTGSFANALPTITHLMPGRFSTTRPLFGNISGLEIRPVATFNSALAALT